MKRIRRMVRPALLTLLILVLCSTSAGAQVWFVMTPAGGGGEQFADVSIKPGERRGYYIYLCVGSLSNPYCLPNQTLTWNSIVADTYAGGHHHNNWGQGYWTSNSTTTGSNGEPAYLEYQAGSGTGRLWFDFYTEFLGNGYIVSTTNALVSSVNDGGADFPDIGYGQFVRVGFRAEHPINHFARGDFADGMHLLANDYIDTWPDQPVLAYNDSSLQKGGIFDLNRNYAPPHDSHRLGTSVDVRANGGPNSIPFDEEIRDWFRNRVLEIFGVAPLHEAAGTQNEHFHVRTYGPIEG